MSQDNIKYYLNTYTSYSHNHAIAALSSNNAQYTFEFLTNEEVFSRFQVMSDNETYNIVKELIQENNGTAITIEYGSY